MKAKPILLYGIASVMLFSLFLLTGCDPNRGEGASGIPINEKNAAQHVIPYDSVRYYIDAFAEGRKELEAQLKDSSFLNSRFNMPVAERFNRDAIAALLNAPDAQGVRIYLGRKPNGEVVFVLVPTNKAGNDINVKLIIRSGNNTQSKEDAASADPNMDGEGIENGQRCPTICDEKR